MACPGGSCVYLHGSGWSGDVLNSFRHRSLSNLTSATINSRNGSRVYLVSAAGCWIRRDQEDSIDASRFLRHLAATGAAARQLLDLPSAGVAQINQLQLHAPIEGDVQGLQQRQRRQRCIPPVCSSRGSLNFCPAQQCALCRYQGSTTMQTVNNVSYHETITMLQEVITPFTNLWHTHLLPHTLSA